MGHLYNPFLFNPNNYLDSSYPLIVVKFGDVGPQKQHNIYILSILHYRHSHHAWHGG